jgi:hypothetical protein
MSERCHSTCGGYRESADARFDLDVPPARIAIEAGGETGAPWHGSMETEATNGQEVVLPVRRTCGIRVRLAEDGGEIPWSDDQHLDVTFLDPTIADDEPGSSWCAGSVRLKHPGRYRVTVRTNDEYEPAAPLEVDVPEGEWVDRVVNVVRRR